MKAKASVAEAHIGNRSIICSKIGQMTTAINKIVVPCSFLMNWGDAELGKIFLNSISKHFEKSFINLESWYFGIFA